jgi:hypothetical protein
MLITYLILNVSELRFNKWERWYIAVSSSPKYTIQGALCLLPLYAINKNIEDH